MILPMYSHVIDYAESKFVSIQIFNINQKPLYVKNAFSRNELTKHCLKNVVPSNENFVYNLPKPMFLFIILQSKNNLLGYLV